MKRKTRPAKVGDVLYRTETAHSVGEIIVGEPVAHPKSGVATALPLITLRATLFVRAVNCQAIEPACTDPSTEAFGQPLTSGWGCPSSSDWRSHTLAYRGNSIATLFDTARRELDGALKTVESVADKHIASVLALERARATELAKWRVPV